MSDMINHPSHYETQGIECIAAMEITQGREAVKNFCLCNAYLWRHKKKNGLEDLKKLGGTWTGPSPCRTRTTRLSEPRSNVYAAEVTPHERSEWNIHQRRQPA